MIRLTSGLLLICTWALCTVGSCSNEGATRLPGCGQNAPRPGKILLDSYRRDLDKTVPGLTVHVFLYSMKIRVARLF